MKIMVTGGAGFVGTNLIKRLLKDGHEVVSIDNYSTGTEENHQALIKNGENAVLFEFQNTRDIRTHEKQ